MCLHVKGIMMLRSDIRFYKIFLLDENGELYTPYMRERVDEKYLAASEELNTWQLFGASIVEGGVIHGYADKDTAIFVARNDFKATNSVVVCEVQPLGELVLTGRGTSSNGFSTVLNDEVGMRDCIIDKLVWCSFGDADDYELVWEKCNDSQRLLEIRGDA